MRRKKRRLATLAKWINENSKQYKAEIIEGYCNTDRQLYAGSRIRIEGKGREGNKIIIRDKETNKIVKEHNSAETYRYNYEIEDWVNKNIPNANNKEYTFFGNFG